MYHRDLYEECGSYHISDHNNYKMAHSLSFADNSSSISRCLEKFSAAHASGAMLVMKENLSALLVSTYNDGLNLHCDDGDKLCEAVDSGDFFYNPESGMNENLKSIVESCTQRGLIKKVVRDIPPGALPFGLTGSITDISVRSRGPDEIVYNKHHELRSFIPRGFTLMRIENSDSNLVTECCVVYSFKKFCGSAIDEDDLSGKDDDEIDMNEDKYFLQDLGVAAKIVAMEKVNGEAAHFTGRFIKGEFYLIAGSKNVHLLFQNGHQIEMYTESRYSIAKVIAHAVLKQWLRLDQQKRTLLAQFLHLSRTTVSCEILLPSHQHVVNLSDLPENRLVVVALTPPPEDDSKSLIAMPSEETLDLFQSLGFAVAEHEPCQPNELQNHIKKTRKAKNTEGIVYYYQDSHQNTIGMVKLKSSWYIHLRALREQASYRHTSKKKDEKNLNFFKHRARTRMLQLQAWLLDSDEELRQWQDISDAFLDWLEQQVADQKVQTDTLRGNFPIHWKEFCDDTGMLSKNSNILK